MDRISPKFIEKSGVYSEEEIVLLKDEISFKQLKKHDFILKPGDVCSSLIYIVEGAIYQYKIDTDLEKNVLDLNIAHDWVIDKDSFTSRGASNLYIEAFDDCLIYELSIESIHALIAKSQSFLQLGKAFGEVSSRLNFFDNNLSPDEKYVYLQEHKPELLQKFPLKLIASYLKITPETLSRVRHRFFKS
ncbi:Crp/Fnr family transcriptional regulator [Seonamhaeicola marinus]|uniref:Crp/Fnr family transcriptional regulator n=1 Tax=Seonamhaeicola marinus TaxID=1912246 RepID=A0A5D0HTI6_9FLAO|nr:Crp/Fnr family transcriptional regulator [Seonamhaeicola marinus]TYA74625.1 Crp/Fnr family transcriptional regulator [Seonamhaeicola marinus]